MSKGRLFLTVFTGLAVSATFAAGQARRGSTPAPAASSTAVRTEPAKMRCPQPLGQGLQTGRMFCDVVITREPTDGVIVFLPAHTGAMTLTFDLHNRHTYSEELVKAKRGYRRYTATIGLLALDNTPLGKAVVYSEFRAAQDLFDRVSGGSGPAGVKAVAPTGIEPVTIIIPADEPTEGVSIVGLKLTEQRVDAPADTFVASGRPVAVISNVMLEYRPAPPRPVKRGK
jgi:hypothetical protein